MLKRIMEKFNIVEDEKFDIYRSDTLQIKGAYFRDGRLYDALGGERYANLGRIVCGEEEIRKIPFVPKEGEDFFYVSVNGVIVSTTYRQGTLELACRYMGNCFESHDVAEKNKSKMMSRFKAIQYGVVNN